MKRDLEALFGLGGKVALVSGARRAERLESLAVQLRELGVRACEAPADVTVTEQIESATQRVEAELGPIEILVNGAGIARPSRSSSGSMRTS